MRFELIDVVLNLTIGGLFTWHIVGSRDVVHARALERRARGRWRLGLMIDVVDLSDRERLAVALGQGLVFTVLLIVNYASSLSSLTRWTRLWLIVSCAVALMIVLPRLAVAIVRWTKRTR